MRISTLQNSNKAYNEASIRACGVDDGGSRVDEGGSRVKGICMIFTLKATFLLFNLSNINVRTLIN